MRSAVGWALGADANAFTADKSVTLDAYSDTFPLTPLNELPAGEYAVCALLPGDNQPGSPQVCLGNSFRKRTARTVSLSPGETVRGADIFIPLHAIHSVAGSLVQAITNQSPSKARLHLLYADDREEAMAVDMFDDGTFLFPFVPEGSYILQVTDAVYSEMPPEDGPSKATPKQHPLASREMAVPVNGALRDIKVPLAEAPPGPAAKP